MEFQSYLRVAKYAVKSLVLSWSPALYWRLRQRLKGHGEAELMLLPILCRKDATSVDIGAHFGMYTFGMLQHSRCVHSFEPVPRLAKVLKAGYRSDPRAFVHRGALSADSGVVTLRAPVSGLGRSTIEAKNTLHGMKDPSGIIERRSVVKWTLDEFGLSDVALIKIDVEGHEEAVLEGGLATLRACRPALIIELEERHNPGCRQRVTELLGPLGYVRFQFDGFRMVSGNRSPRNNFVFLQPEHVQSVSLAGIVCAEG